MTDLKVCKACRWSDGYTSSWAECLSPTVNKNNPSFFARGDGVRRVDARGLGGACGIEGRNFEPHPAPHKTLWQRVLWWRDQ